MKTKAQVQILGKASRPSKAETGLRIAYTWALRGTCARRQVGCLLVDKQHHTLSTGYNGPAAGLDHCTERPCPGATLPSGQGLDLCEAIHAEQNALLYCPDVRLIHTCYTTSSPCITCVKLLLNTSCQKIVFCEEYPHPEARVLWKEKAGRVWLKLEGKFKS